MKNIIIQNYKSYIQGSIPLDPLAAFFLFVKPIGKKWEKEERSFSNKKQQKGFEGIVFIILLILII